jgi:hypothetical protein
MSNLFNVQTRVEVQEIGLVLGIAELFRLFQVSPDKAQKIFELAAQELVDIEKESGLFNQSVWLKIEMSAGELIKIKSNVTKAKYAELKNGKKVLAVPHLGEGDGENVE